VLQGHTGALFGRRFSPDGTAIVTASVTHCAVWDAVSGRSLAVLRSYRCG